MLTTHGDAMAAVTLDGGQDLLSNGTLPHRLTITCPCSRLPWSSDPTRIVKPTHGITVVMLSLSLSCSSLHFYFLLSDSSLLRPPLIVVYTLSTLGCCALSWSLSFCLPLHFPPLEMQFPLSFL